MKSYWIDVKNGKRGIVDVKNYKKFYELIDCRCFDIATRKIGGKSFDIVIDDEGLLKSEPIVSAFDKFGDAMLIGNLVICGKADRNGNQTPLTDEDIDLIESNLFTVYNGYTSGMYIALGNLQY